MNWSTLTKHMLKLLLILLILPVYGFSQTYNVGEKTIVYTDSSRNRLVKTELWYPTREADSEHKRKTDLPFLLEPTIRNANISEQKHSLIIISHGTGGNRFSLAWLAIELAKQGYIVAALDHYGNTFDNKIPEYFVRYWERPLDISFLLTELLNNNELKLSIDKEKIGMLGFSFGGYTSLALAGAFVDCSLLKQKAKTPEGKKEFTIPELGDLTPLITKIPCKSVATDFTEHRIKAFVALSPALGLGITEVKNEKHPSVLIIAAENDKVAPVTTNAMRYHQLFSGSQLDIVEGEAGHYIFLNEANKHLKKVAQQYYQDSNLVNRALVHQQVTKKVEAFFKSTLD